MASGHSVHFVEDNDLSPLAFAEQYVDPDPTKAQNPEILLRQARMILATELGVDPLLRKYVRDQFKLHAQFSVLPTERGQAKIDEYSFQFVSFQIILSVLLR
jgi:transcription elongation factor SPT6